MGTGSGVGAVFAAQWARRVVAVDINPAAVRCARINALLNHVEDRVDVVEGDLFEPIGGQRFDDCGQDASASSKSQNNCQLRSRTLPEEACVGDRE